MPDWYIWDLGGESGKLEWLAGLPAEFSLQSLDSWAKLAAKNKASSSLRMPNSSIMQDQWLTSF